MKKPNKQGSFIKRHAFFYRGNKIENVKEYKYLGFTFTISESSTTGIATLIKQAKKACSQSDIISLIPETEILAHIYHCLTRK